MPPMSAQKIKCLAHHNKIARALSLKSSRPAKIQLPFFGQRIRVSGIAIQ
jgi:hypothetical protein